MLSSVSALGRHRQESARPRAFPPIDTRGAPGSQVPSELGYALDLNRASQDDLVQVPGIGPVLAARILEKRQREGRFRRVEELLSVKGIGPRTLERIRSWLKVDESVPP